jgi:hypothetical protein
MSSPCSNHKKFPRYVKGTLLHHTVYSTAMYHSTKRLAQSHLTTLWIPVTYVRERHLCSKTGGVNEA